VAESLELEDVLQEVFTAQALGLWTTLPASVVAFDGGGVSVAPSATLQPFPNDYAGGDPVPLPQLQNVPVCFPAGIRKPLVAGDVVLVHFASRSIERWRGGDGTGDPQSFRHHHLSDGFCVPLLASLNAPAIGTAPKAARVGDDVSAAGNPAVPGDMANWIAVVTAFLNAAAPGTVTAPTNFGTITTGSATVEIDD